MQSRGERKEPEKGKKANSPQKWGSLRFLKGGVGYGEEELQVERKKKKCPSPDPTKQTFWGFFF